MSGAKSNPSWIKLLLRDRFAAALFITLVLSVLFALLAPWISPYHPDAQSIDDRLLGPSSAHWLGTDSLGRDLATRLLFGARLSLSIGIATAIFSLVLGTITGALAGFFRGWMDRVITGFIDFFSIFPSLLLAILFSLIFGRGVFGIFLSIGIVAWVQHARLVRAQVLQASELPYVESARALGISDQRILWRHVLPNLWGPILVSVSAQIPSNIMAESFLSFLGLGLQPPHASWGTLASEGTRALRSHPHLLIFPSVALFSVLLASQYLGDWLRDRVSASFRAESTD
ncbi:MAG: ABC transporter permease [Bdellovibrionales bacterium]|nr:ABC transporter permease [Bdellovibrionales bacterium]